ncbi:MAG: hypothetical protein ABIP68_05880, partial [Ferruginibacter sp.]
IAIQTLPYLYNNYDSGLKLVNEINSINKSLDPSFKVISTSNSKISVCKTIKNITFTKDDNVIKLTCQFLIFWNNKCLSVIYSAYSSDLNKIISFSDEFVDFCTSQASRIIVYSALEKPGNCTIQSNAIENKTNVSIILNNSCKWFKSENQTESLNIINHETNSSLSIGISNEERDLKPFTNLSTNELAELKKGFIKSFKSSQIMENFGLVKINQKNYIYFKTKSDVDNTIIFTDNYYYVLGKRFIWFLSMVKDKNKTSIEGRFKQSHSDVLELLNSIEYISNSK